MIKIYVALCFLSKAYICRCVFKENTRARYDPALSIHEDDCADRILYVPSDSSLPTIFKAMKRDTENKKLQQKEKDCFNK